MPHKKILRFGIGLAVAALFLYLTLRLIDPEDARQALRSANVSLLVLAFLAVAGGYLCRIHRWRHMLKAANSDITWRQCAGPLLAGFALNNVLPFRAGDFARSFAFNALLGTTSGVVVTTLISERLLDLLVLLFLLGLTITLFGSDSSELITISGASFVALAGALLFLLLFPRPLKWLIATVARFVARIVPRLKPRIDHEVDRSSVTLIHLSDPRCVVRLILWSFLAWLAEGCAFWLTALSLRMASRPAAGWLALPVGSLSTLIPSSPGYVGSFDYFATQAFASAGNDFSVAALYALLVHAVIFIPPTLGGALYLIGHRAIPLNAARSDGSNS